jgi:hypothetical protein
MPKLFNEQTVTMIVTTKDDDDDKNNKMQGQKTHS